MGLRSLLVQLLWLASLKVETLCAQQVKSEGGRGGGSLTVQWTKGDILMDEATDSKLGALILCGVATTAGCCDFSLATDKASVAGFPLVNSCLALASGEAFVCAPQVDRGFDEALRVTDLDGAKKVGEAGPLAQASRHKAWLSRGRDGARAAAWRPAARYRLASTRWLQQTDNQLRIHTKLGGWQGVQFTGASEVWAPDRWQSWPHVNLTIDMGSDGLCASHGLQYSWATNVTRWTDFSHGSHKDLDICLRDLGLHQLWLVMMISWNLMHGPDQSDGRWHEVRSLMAAVYSDHDWQSSPLFRKVSHRIAAEHQRAGYTFELAEGQVLEQAVWDFCRKSEDSALKGYRCNMNRFLGSLCEARRCLVTWSKDWFERTMMALEKDMLHGSNLMKLVLKPEVGDLPHECGASTSSARPTMETKQLRAACGNAVVISVLALSDYGNRRKLQIMVCIAEQLLHWHTAQSRQLRSCEGGLEWVKKEVSEGFMVHLRLTIQSYMSEQVFADFEFMKPPGSGGRIADENLHMLIDDEAADMLGQGCFTMAFVRCRRFLWLVSGWPHRWAAALVPEKQAQTIAAWRQDQRAFEAYRACELLIKEDRDIIERHQLGLVSNKQIECAMQASGDVFTEEFGAFLVRRTQPVEDLNNVQKNSAQIRGSKKYRKPARSWAVVLKKETLHKQHRYKKVPVHSSLLARSRGLPADCFLPDPKKMSLRFSDICGRSQKAPFFSPGAPMHNVVVADLYMLREAMARGNFRMPRMAWLGQLCDIKHRLLLRRKMVNGQREHFLAAFHYAGSSVLVWPIRLVTVPGITGDGKHTFEATFEEAQPTMVPVWTLEAEEIMATTYAWRSWLWQRSELGGACRQLSEQIRPFVDKDFRPLLQVCAEKAFWELPKSFLLKLSTYQGYEVSEGADLHIVVYDVVKAATGRSDAEVLNIAHQRVVAGACDSETAEQFLMVDEGVECLDIHDHKKFRHEQETTRVSQRERASYSAAYRERRATIAPPHKAARTRQRAGKGGSASPYPPRIPSTIAQSEAKRFVPEGASIWRALVRSSWAAHLPPYPRISESWAIGGEQAALRRILKRLWTQHNERLGRGLVECPIEGLFEESSAS